jgi:uncharacterized membrane protein YkvA (DUF1232 family)
MISSFVHFLGSLPLATSPHLVITVMTSDADSRFKLEKLPSFPRTLFAFRHYDGWKTIIVILFLLASVYFLTGFWGFLVDHNQWLHDWIHSSQPVIEVPKKPWWNLSRLLGNNSIANVFTSAFSYADILFRLLIFLVAYCLVWAAFDPRNIEGYVMGVFNAALGSGYMLSPIDLFPDPLPIVGSLDDTVFGAGMVFLGASVWYRARIRDLKTKTILDLVNHGNTQRALQLLLEDKGIAIDLDK